MSRGSGLGHGQECRVVRRTYTYSRTLCQAEDPPVYVRQPLMSLRCFYLSYLPPYVLVVSLSISTMRNGAPDHWLNNLVAAVVVVIVLGERLCG